MSESAELNEASSTSYNPESDAEAILPNPDILSASTHLAELNTEELLHKVVEAAEHNQALEKLLELRHEVKDRPDHIAPAAGAASKVSDILPLHPAYGFNPAQTHIQRQSKLNRLIHDKSMYGYAVRYGFAAAVISLFMAIIVISLFTR